MVRPEKIMILMYQGWGRSYLGHLKFEIREFRVRDLCVYVCARVYVYVSKQANIKKIYINVCIYLCISGWIYV